MSNYPGQKPVDVQAKKAKGKPYGRQAVWEALRQHGVSGDWTSLSTLALAVRQNKRTVDDYCKALCAGGYAEGKKIRAKIEGHHNTTHNVYRLIRDTGVHAPRLNARGEAVITARDHMWRCMKMLDHFGPDELAVVSSTEDCMVAAADANKYCQCLHKAGYLLVIQPATTQCKAEYKLRASMKTGPHAPMIQRTKVVFDPNLQRIMWHEDLEP